MINYATLPTQGKFNLSSEISAVVTFLHPLYKIVDSKHISYHFKKLL